MSRILEIACFNIKSAIIAEKSGADRIELCDNYSVGGITPSEEMILQTRKKIQIPVHVIVRPRGGNFYYSEEEREEMKKNIVFCKQQKINGIVLGCLTSENRVDLNACKDLIDLARPMTVTFHRAIDVCDDIEAEVKKLIDLGVDRVLTSGGKNNAMEGKSVLEDLQNKFRDKIIILPGGGIRSGNLSEIIKTTHCLEYHSAALINNSSVCDENEIRALKQIMNSL